MLLILKLLLTVLIFHSFYSAPLELGGSLRTHFQNEELFDSNYYDYVSAKIASSTLGESIGLIYSTWNSFGVILYISTIYKCFGINTVNVVICNVFIVSLGIIKLVKSLNLTDNKRHILVLTILLFMPYHVYHDATPSKESLTIGLFLLSLAEYIKMIVSKKENYNFLSLVLLTLVRPMLGILVFVWIQRNKLFASGRSFIYFIIGFVLFFYLTPIILHVDLLEYLKVSNIFVLNDLAQERLALSGIKLRIFELFGASNFLSLILYSPVRLIIWLILPFPLLELPIDGVIKLSALNWLDYVQSGQKLFRTIGVLYYLPFLSLFLLNWQRSVRSDLGRFIFFISLLISSYTFINSSRYRLIVEPLIIVQVLTSKYETEGISSIRIV